MSRSSSTIKTSNLPSSSGGGVVPFSSVDGYFQAKMSGCTAGSLTASWASAIESDLATAGAIETQRLRQRAELIRELLAPRSTERAST